MNKSKSLLKSQAAMSIVMATIYVLLSLLVVFVIGALFGPTINKDKTTTVKAVSEPIYINNTEYFQVLTLKNGNFCSITHSSKEVRLNNCWR